MFCLAADEAVGVEAVLSTASGSAMSPLVVGNPIAADSPATWEVHLSLALGSAKDKL